MQREIEVGGWVIPVAVECQMWWAEGFWENTKIRFGGGGSQPTPSGPPSPYSCGNCNGVGGHWVGPNARRPRSISAPVHLVYNVYERQSDAGAWLLMQHKWIFELSSIDSSTDNDNVDNVPALWSKANITAIVFSACKASLVQSTKNTDLFKTNWIGLQLTANCVDDKWWQWYKNCISIRESHQSISRVLDSSSVMRWSVR